MANNYTQFSEVIDGITPEECKWIELILSEVDGLMDLEDVVGRASKEGQKLLGLIDTLGVGECDIENSWPGFGWEIKPITERNDKDRKGPQYLWIYSEEAGDVDHVRFFIQAFLRKFRPTEVFKMTWADTCSRLRVGEFSGGGLAISKDDVYWVCSEDSVNEAADIMKAKLSKP